MIKNILIAVAITFAIMFAFISSVEARKVSVLKKELEAHKMAITFANKAIHTFSDPHFRVVNK